MRENHVRRGMLAAVAAAAAISWLAPREADASFHLWDVVEVYTNADGSVQYFELASASDFQTATAGRGFRVTVNGVTFADFALPGPNLTGSTLNRRLLIATPGYAALAGEPSADFVIPLDELNPSCNCFIPPDASETVVIGIFGALQMTLTPDDPPLPINGVDSANQQGLNIVSAAASPTNFAGTTCSFGCPDAGPCTADTGGCSCAEGRNCNDGNDCTTDGCTGFSCTHAPLNSGSCNDGLFCTATDTCSAGACGGSGDACPGQMCNETTNACVECLSPSDCADESSCNGAERCTAGSCRTGIDPCPGALCIEGSTPTCVECLDADDCDDDSVCTDDSCNGSGVCVRTNNTADCDDGLFCNGAADTCSGGVCSGSGDPCPDENCNEGADECAACLVAGDCDDGNRCTVNTCATGDCVATNADDDTDCADEVFCDGEEVCASGACVAPGNPCDPALERCVEAADACELLCGNGLINGDEECDDDGNDDLDGCSALCAIEPGWDCPSETVPSECASFCGDGETALGAEACDDENTDADDGCSDTCAVEDGWMCAPEAEGLADLCESILNDGLIRGGEVCDDDNEVTGDGCHDGAVEAGFVCNGEPSVCEEDEGHDDEDAGDGPAEEPGDGPEPDVGGPDTGDTGDAGPGDVGGDGVVGDDDGTSQSEDSGCCRTASSRQAPEALLWALVLGLGWARRRRRS